jgi:hypothetical protein
VTPARLAARALELLGPVGGAVVVVAPAAAAVRDALSARLAVARDGDGDGAAAAVVVFLRAPARPHERQQVLGALRRRLGEGAPVVVVDHNQPRTAWRRALATLALLASGLGPARARYPAARELAALGFRVERLALASGERVQLVSARR